MQPLSMPQVPQHMFYCNTWPPPPIEVPFNYDNKTDEELLWLFKKGDRSQRNNAFNTIYNRYRLDVASYCGTCMDREEEAKDLFADVWVEVSKKLITFEWRGIPICRWLIKTAKYIKLNKDRKKSEIPCHDIETLMELDSSKEVDNPIDILLRKESDRRVIRAISELKNPLQKKILMAIYINGITSSKELAKKFKTTPNNIRVNHHRALKKLKESEKIRK